MFSRQTRSASLMFMTREEDAGSSWCQLLSCSRVASHQLMAQRLFLFSGFTAFVAVLLLYFCPDSLSPWLPRRQPSCLSPADLLLSPDSLKQHDGSDPSKGIYLAFLGIVYDVSRGAKHYGPGGTYSMFAGRDATRAFVTGNFESDHLQDDVTDLESAAFAGIKEWEQFYAREYSRVGLVIGSYYDSNGCPTSKRRRVEAAYQEAEAAAVAREQEEVKYPPCNSEWSEGSKVTRFWCSNMSGGRRRDWTGVPRQLFSPESKSSRCACVPTPAEQQPAIHYDEESEDPVDPRIRPFPDCPVDASQCLVPDDRA